MRTIILALGLSARCLTAQQPAAPAPDSAAALEAKGDSVYGAGTAAARRMAADLWLLAADSYRRASAPGKAGEMLANVGMVHRQLSRPDSALVYYSRALLLVRDAHDRRLEAVVLKQLAQTHYNGGKLDSALAYTRLALDVSRATGDTSVVAGNLHNLGLLSHDLGRPDTALVLLRQALAMRRALGERPNQGVTLNALGRVSQTLGRYADAVAYFQQSLAARRAAKTRDLAGEALTLNNIGYSYDLARQPDSAITYYREALTLARQVDAKSNEGLTSVNIGRVQLTLGHPDSAEYYLRRGLAITREVKDAAREVWALDDFGSFFLATGHADSARAYYDQALAVVRRVGDRAREGYTLAHLGDAYYRGEPRDAGRSAAYYDSAAAVRATVARFAGGDANRLSFAEQDVQLVEGWALAWLARAGDPAVGPARAAAGGLAAAERGRAQALLDLMRASAGSAAPLVYAAGSQPATGSPGADLAAEGERLARRVARPGTAALSYLVMRDTLVVWAIAPSGAVSVARRAVSRDSVAELVEALRAGLGVDDAAVGNVLVAVRGTTALSAARRRPRVVRKRPEDAAAALGALLLPEELRAGLAGVRELVVVPNGPLSLVPFAALPLGGAAVGGGGYGSVYAVRYAPSLTALVEAEARAGSATATAAGRDAAFRRALVIGNPAMPRVAADSGEPVELRPLPASATEAAGVAALLHSASLTGLRATEAEVRRRLPAAPLVHLATHGYAYDSDARVRESFIALAPGDGQDGLLTVGELLDDPSLVLTAELVVLSACQTGLGDLKQAEGTVGLQRAFLARGARSALVSLWSVADEPTQLLMRRFYAHWLSDRDRPSKAESLRRAQDDVRRVPGYEHPRFWAAFQLVGAR